MKHFIIVKFNETVDVEAIINPIKELFNKALAIKGISSITIYKSNSDLSNRHDLMIEMILTKAALIEFDNSYIHKEWKEAYGDLILNKTIFDCD
ncbi:MAG: hypothetical protein IJO33_05425 [Bacilli bacterium]|nr:hypothetical protein [Bacilli bacterium]